jgi:hypothetical protein
MNPIRLLALLMLFSMLFFIGCSNQASLSPQAMETHTQENDHSAQQNSASPSPSPAPLVIQDSSYAPQSKPVPSALPVPVVSPIPPKQVPPPTPEAEETAAVSTAPHLDTAPTAEIKNKSMGVPESSPVRMSYFDDALFIGDSNTWRFKNFIHKKRKSDSDYMGKAVFLSKKGYGLRHAVKDKPIEDEHGNEWQIIEYLEEHRFNKIYIMLGTNDIEHGVNKAVDNYLQLISRIREVSDADLYIQSVLPMCRDTQEKGLNNENIDKFNKKMYEHSKSLHCYYLDVASCMKDSKGNLPTKYSSDNHVHIHNRAFPLWVDYLRTHTK